MTLSFQITPTHVKLIGDGSGYAVGEQCKVDENLMLAADILKVAVPIYALLHPALAHARKQSSQSLFPFYLKFVHPQHQAAQ